MVTLTICLFLGWWWLLNVSVRHSSPSITYVFVLIPLSISSSFIEHFLAVKKWFLSNLSPTVIARSAHRFTLFMKMENFCFAVLSPGARTFREHHRPQILFLLHVLLSMSTQTAAEDNNDIGVLIYQHAQREAEKAKAAAAELAPCRQSSHVKRVTDKQKQ
jgi:hypothetical protein